MWVSQVLQVGTKKDIIAGWNESPPARFEMVSKGTIWSLLPYCPINTQRLFNIVHPTHLLVFAMIHPTTVSALNPQPIPSTALALANGTPPSQGTSPHSAGLLPQESGVRATIAIDCLDSANATTSRVSPACPQLGALPGVGCPRECSLGQRSTHTSPEGYGPALAKHLATRGHPLTYRVITRDHDTFPPDSSIRGAWPRRRSERSRMEGYTSADRDQPVCGSPTFRILLKGREVEHLSPLLSFR